MPRYFNEIFFKKLLSSKTETVRDPLFFRITTPSGAIFDLLGTIHSLSLNVLPECILETLPSYDNVIFETRLNTNATDIATSNEVYQRLLRNIYDINWFIKLDSIRQNILEQILPQWVTALNTQSSLHLTENIHVANYKYEFIYSFLLEAIGTIALSSKKEAAVRIVSSGMDQNLAKLFLASGRESEALALESVTETTAIMYSTLNEAIDINKLKVLLDLYVIYCNNSIAGKESTFYAMIEQLKAIYISNKQEELMAILEDLRTGLCSNDANEFVEKIEILYKNGSEHLSSSNAVLVDELITQGDMLHANIRNKMWFPRIIGFANLTGQKLFCCGLLHLLGKYGLLTKFAANGFLIEKMDQHGKFHDCTGIIQANIHSKITDFSNSSYLSMMSVDAQKQRMCPREIRGWLLHDVTDNNCFYHAVIHQLYIIRHDFLQSIPCGMLASDSLRQQIRGREFNDGDWNGYDAEIIKLARSLRVIVAIVDTREFENGFVYYFINAAGLPD